MIRWRDIEIEKPEDYQECLTITKHGIIQGTYNEIGDLFSGYYWRDMEWYATKWVPIEGIL